MLSLMWDHMYCLQSAYYSLTKTHGGTQEDRKKATLVIYSLSTKYLHSARAINGDHSERCAKLNPRKCLSEEW